MRRFMIALVLMAACDSPKPTPPKPPPTGPDEAVEPTAADAKPYAARNTTEDGAVGGRVVFKGDIPSLPAPDPTTECLMHREHLINELIVRDGAGGLQNVFVYVKSGDVRNWTFDVPAEPVTIDQRGCRYYPHVQGMVAGQSMKIKNSDGFLHNVHSLPKENDGWSIAQPGIQEDTLTAATRFKAFGKREVMVPVKCDVHAWMGSWVGVLPHTLFTVSGADGSFEIKGVPPGTYTIEAWHEFLGNKDAKPRATAPLTKKDVVVEAGKTLTLDFEFKM